MSAVVCLSLFIVVSPSPFAADPNPPVAFNAAAAQPPIVKVRQCTRRDFHRRARQVYRTRSPVTAAERGEIRRLVHCLRRPVSRRIVRKALVGYKRGHRNRVLWAYYKAHPMPYCTWANESGKPWESPEWAPSARYSIYNSRGSGARGKYQIMPSTWAGNGGGASWAPLEQERVGRNLYAARGTQPWDGCH